MKNRVIQTVSGHIGSGKSYHMRAWLAEQIADDGGNPIPVTLATPTNGLSNEHHDEFTELGIPSMVISQNAGFRSSAEGYRNHCDVGYEGVLITNNLVALNTAANTANRLLIIDEAFPPFETIKIKFKKPEDVRELNVSEVTDIVEGGQPMYEVVRSGAMNYALIDPHDTDENYKGYGEYAKQLAAYINNEHYRVVIDQASFNRAASGIAFVERDEKGNVIAEKSVWLQFTIFMLSSIVDVYKDTMILSANFDETLLGLMWSKDVDFQTNEDIQSRLRYPDLKHVADFVELHHAPVKNLSKTFLTRLGRGNEEKGTQEYLDRVASCLGQMFPAREHIHCSNKLTETTDYKWALDGELGGERVITNPFGWNKFKHCTMAVFLAAINLDPDTEERLFAIYSITKAQAKNAVCHQMVYQFIGRTLIRDKDAIKKTKKKVVLVLSDEGAAEAVQLLLGCAASTPLPIDFGEQPKRGRPRIEKTADQKRQEAKIRKRLSRANAAEKATQLQLEPVE